MKLLIILILAIVLIAGCIHEEPPEAFTPQTKAELIVQENSEKIKEDLQVFGLEMDSNELIKEDENFWIVIVYDPYRGKDVQPLTYCVVKAYVNKSSEKIEYLRFGLLCPPETEENKCKNFKCFHHHTIVQTAMCKGSARCFDSIITKIVDGDTLDVNNTTHIVRIRLALVDAPEPDQTGGPEAKEFVSSICPVGSSAKVDEDDNQTKGSLGRIVAAIYCNKITLNNELLVNDHAVIDQRFCNISEFANENWAKDEC